VLAQGRHALSRRARDEKSPLSLLEQVEMVNTERKDRHAGFQPSSFVPLRTFMDHWRRGSKVMLRPVTCECGSAMIRAPERWPAFKPSTKILGDP